jgi:seryl-tRNA synthetase
MIVTLFIMIDVALLREQPELIKKKIADKKADPALVDTFQELDTKWKALVNRIDENRRLQKELSAARQIDQAQRNKEEIKKQEEELAILEKEREFILHRIPNIADDSVPIGNDESENQVIRAWGTPPVFDFEVKDHMELGEQLGIIDTARASTVSGSRFCYLKGDAALLEFALISHALKVLTDQTVLSGIAKKLGDTVSAKPFVPVVPPVMIRPSVFIRMGRLDPGQEEERYYLPKDDMYLVGSAEHTLGPLHMDETIPHQDLPIRYVGFSTAFRREAGSYGRDVKGILRMHQFDKIEIESFTTAEDSRNEQDFIVALQEYLMQSLELPYQVVSVCTGDMGAPDARQIDIETWMPSQKKYRETHSSDMVSDYQARRLKTRVKRADGSVELAHMNDATVFAIGRTLIAIIENNQTAAGTIRIPTVLQPYVGKKEIIKTAI